MFNFRTFANGMVLKTIHALSKVQKMKCVQILRNHKAKNSYLDALIFHFKELRIDAKVRADIKPGESMVNKINIEAKISGVLEETKNYGNILVKNDSAPENLKLLGDYLTYEGTLDGILVYMCGRARSATLIGSRADCERFLKEVVLRVKHEHLGCYRICSSQGNPLADKWGKNLRQRNLFLVCLSDRANEKYPIIVKPCGMVCASGLPESLRFEKGSCFRIKYWERVGP